MARVTVLGAGSWGTALSIVLADNHHDVYLWTHRKNQADLIQKTRENKQYLNEPIPENIMVTNDLKKAVQRAEIILFVVPTNAIREVAQQVNEYLRMPVTLIHASKGIEPETLKRVSQMISEEIVDYPIEDIAVLSGPSHAEEVAKRQPTTVTASSINEDQAKLTQDLFINQSFRVYTSTDMIGIELGGALKNIIALGAGISDGLDFGDNAKAALITRGLAEIARLGTSLGANPLTFIGLSGVGDLIVTCTSSHSRNWRAGHLLGKGNKLETVLHEMGMVVEGVRTTKAAHELAKSQGIEMPITTGIYRLLFDHEPPEKVVEYLMSRTKREELDDFASLLRNRPFM